MGLDIGSIISGGVQALESGITEGAGTLSKIPDPIALGIQAVGGAVGLDPKLIALAEMGVGAATGDVMCAIHGVNDIMTERSKPVHGAQPAPGYAAPKASAKDATDEADASDKADKAASTDEADASDSTDKADASDKADATDKADASSAPDKMDYATAAATISKNFDLFDTAAGIGGKDGLIAKCDLQAVANDPNAPADARAAAKFFLDSPTQLNQLDVAAGVGKVDGLIAKCDLDAAAKSAPAKADTTGETESSKKADSTSTGDAEDAKQTKKADDTGSADSTSSADDSDFGKAIDDILNNPKLSVEEKVLMIMAKLEEKQEGRIQGDMDKLANAEKENNAHRGDKDYKQVSTQSIQQDLQMAMSKRAELTSFASNFEKMEHEMRTSVINNIR